MTNSPLFSHPSRAGFNKGFDSYLLCYFCSVGKMMSAMPPPPPESLVQLIRKPIVPPPEVHLIGRSSQSPRPPPLPPPPPPSLLPQVPHPQSALLHHMFGKIQQTRNGELQEHAQAGVDADVNILPPRRPPPCVRPLCKVTHICLGDAIVVSRLPTELGTKRR